MTRDISVSLAELAGVASMAGDPIRAARLFGAVATLREAASIPHPPVYRTAYERTLAVVRAQLDAEAWDAVWMAGRALTLDQAIAEALGHEDVSDHFHTTR